MAAGDISLRTTNPNPLVVTRQVASGGTATINNGEPTKTGSQISSSGYYVAIMADGNGTTSEVFTGIAKTVSTDTASADGSVDVFIPLPGIIYAAKAKSATAVDTPAVRSTSSWASEWYLTLRQECGPLTRQLQTLPPTKSSLWEAIIRRAPSSSRMRQAATGSSNLD